MNSVILKIASLVLKPLFLMVSVWLLLRGHDYPGGGFIGGLIAGSALIFKPLAAFGKESLPLKNRTEPSGLLALGMACVAVSAIIGLISESIILKSQWIKTAWPIFQTDLKVGTPLLFDLGIYFTVIGFIYIIFISLMEEWQWS